MNDNHFIDNIESYMKDYRKLTGYSYLYPEKWDAEPAGRSNWKSTTSEPQANDREKSFSPESFKSLLQEQDLEQNTIQNYLSRYKKLSEFNVLQDLKDPLKTLKTLYHFYKPLHTIKTMLGFILTYLSLIPKHYRHQICTLQAYSDFHIYLILIQQFIKEKERNTLSTKETKNWVSLHSLHTVLDLLKSNGDRDLYNYVLFYLYIKVCPLRTDLKTVKFKNYNTQTDNFIDTTSWVIHFNKIFKQKGKKLSYSIPLDIRDSLTRFIQKKKNNSDLLFHKSQNFGDYFNTMITTYYTKLYPHSKKKLTLQIIRKIIASETPTESFIDSMKLARDMGHSVQVHNEIYVKNK